MDPSSTTAERPDWHEALDALQAKVNAQFDQLQADMLKKFRTLTRSTGQYLRADRIMAKGDVLFPAEPD